MVETDRCFRGVYCRHHQGVLPHTSVHTAKDNTTEHALSGHTISVSPSAKYGRKRRKSNFVFIRPNSTSAVSMTVVVAVGAGFAILSQFKQKVNRWILYVIFNFMFFSVSVADF
jgi:hypothetical protein